MKYLILIAVSLVLSVTCIACTDSPVNTNESTTVSNQQPIDVVSVRAVGLPNPGGPTIEITLKNVSNEPVVSIKCILQLSGEKTFEYDFFPNVSTAVPLQPDATTSQTLNLIGPTGYSDEDSYPLTITGEFLNGQTFSYVRQIQVT